MPNARLSERAPFFAEVDVLAANAPTPRRVWATDVSESGMFLQTTHPFHVGERVSLRFDVKAHQVHVRAAEVMWVRSFEPISVDGQLPGVGIRFVALDPPSRAALRKFVQPQLDESTLPEVASNELALPPPTASLPPITGSILAMTGRKPPVEITDEMLAVSLEPFSEVPVPVKSLDKRGKSEKPKPRAVTEPMGTPRPISMTPEKKSEMKPETQPFVGWKFKRADVDDGAVQQQSALDDDVAVAPPGLDLRFDDSPPQGVSIAHRDDRFGGDFAGPFEADFSTPPDDDNAFDEPRDTDVTDPGAPSFDDVQLDAVSSFGPSFGPNSVASSRDTNALGDDVERDLADLDRDLESVQSAVEQGELAIRSLPIASERREQHRRRAGFTTHIGQRFGQRALPVAVALLCTGTLVGVGLGLIGKRLKRAPSTSDTIASASEHDTQGALQSAPVVVSEQKVDVSIPLVGLGEPSPSAAASTASTASTASAPRVADVERDLAMGAPADDADVAQAKLALAQAEASAPIESAPVPAELVESKPVESAPIVDGGATLASTVAKAEPSDDVMSPKSGTNASGGDVDSKLKRVSIKVGSGAVVLKSFTLASPSRVVVDVVDAKLPKAPLQPGNGIGRVRFGSPAPGTGRVVVELSGDVDGKASDVEAVIERGVLKIAFQPPR